MDIKQTLFVLVAPLLIFCVVASYPVALIIFTIADYIEDFDDNAE